MKSPADTTTWTPPSGSPSGPVTTPVTVPVPPVSTRVDAGPRRPGREVEGDRLAAEPLPRERDDVRPRRVEAVDEVRADVARRRRRRLLLDVAAGHRDLDVAERQPVAATDGPGQAARRGAELDGVEHGVGAAVEDLGELLRGEPLGLDREAVRARCPQAVEGDLAVRRHLLDRRAVAAAPARSGRWAAAAPPGSSPSPAPRGPRSPGRSIDPLTRPGCPAIATSSPSTSSRGSTSTSSPVALVVPAGYHSSSKPSAV